MGASRAPPRVNQTEVDLQRIDFRIANDRNRSREALICPPKNLRGCLWFFFARRGLSRRVLLREARRLPAVPGRRGTDSPPGTAPPPPGPPTPPPPTPTPPPRT